MTLTYERSGVSHRTARCLRAAFSRVEHGQTARKARAVEGGGPEKR